MTVDDILNQIRSRLNLEAAVEYEVLEEIRGHLEEAVAAAKARGLDERQAMTDAASAFGVEQASVELRQAHAGRGTLDGVAAAALPVTFALILRWLIFAPEGSAGVWRPVVTLPALAVIATVAVLVPLLRFPRRPYAVASWIFFWGLTLAMVAWPPTRG